MSTEARLCPLYADENFPQDAVEELRELGYDVLTVREDGKAGKGYPDDRVLGDAAALGRAVVTLNRRDFRRLHREGEILHQGIVLCTLDFEFKRLAANIHAALSNEETIEGKMISVYRPAKE